MNCHATHQGQAQTKWLQQGSCAGTGTQHYCIKVLGCVLALQVQTDWRRGSGSRNHPRDRLVEQTPHALLLRRLAQQQGKLAPVAGFAARQVQRAGQWRVFCQTGFDGACGGCIYLVG